MVNGESKSGGKSNAVVVHRRHATLVTSWRQSSCPMVTIRLRPAADDTTKRKRKAGCRLQHLISPLATKGTSGMQRHETRASCMIQLNLVRWTAKSSLRNSSGSASARRSSWTWRWQRTTGPWPQCSEEERTTRMARRRRINTSSNGSNSAGGGMHGGRRPLASSQPCFNWVPGRPWAT